MSTLAFELTPRFEASEPPEARGLDRDEVRLMVASRSSGSINHTRFRDLPNHLRPGDLVVVNTSATLPAAIAARRANGTAIEVRFATRAPRQEATELFVVELRSADGLAPLLASGYAGEELQLPGGLRLELLAAYAGRGRLWLARVEVREGLHAYLARHGHPIRYSYVPDPWPLSDYQTVYASVPGSAEMPSAGRPFTAELFTRLASGGTLIAPVTLHAGVSSLESHEPPYPEEYSVPATTARLVNATRAWGGRVIAVGTTVVRALESASRPDGAVRAVRRLDRSGHLSRSPAAGGRRSDHRLA